MSTAWRVLLDEIAQWRDAGRIIDFWWRDDDACRADPALARLTDLADATGTPLALAVIPEGAQSAAFEHPSAGMTILQHGVDHRNRAAAGEKKTEFVACEAPDAALDRLVAGRRHLRSIAGDRWLPVLVPPWNRLASAQLVARLASAGYQGLSTFGARSSRLAAPGLLQLNTHVDIIDWHGGRGFVGEEFVLAQATRQLVDRRLGLMQGDEPIGWLTHHLVHDEAAWAFLAQLFACTGRAGGVRWRSARELFEPGPA